MSGLQRAIASIRAGNKDVGRRLLVAHLHEFPEDAAAWLWLASVTDDQARRIQALQRVLELEPDNALAVKQLARASETQQAEATHVVVAEEQASLPAVPTRPCPYCYSSIDARAVVCPHCQRELPEEQRRNVRNAVWSLLGLIFLCVVLPVYFLTSFEPQYHDVVIRLDGTADRADIAYNTDADNPSSESISLSRPVPWAQSVRVRRGYTVAVIAYVEGSRTASLACTIIIDGSQRDSHAVQGTEYPAMCAAKVSP